jgi:hypothetical protein
VAVEFGEFVVALWNSPRPEWNAASAPSLAEFNDSRSTHSIPSATRPSSRSLMFATLAIRAARTRAAGSARPAPRPSTGEVGGPDRHSVVLRSDWSASTRCDCRGTARRFASAVVPVLVGDPPTLGRGRGRAHRTAGGTSGSTGVAASPAGSSEALAAAKPRRRIQQTVVAGGGLALIGSSFKRNETLKFYVGPPRAGADYWGSTRAGGGGGLPKTFRINPKVGPRWVVVARQRACRIKASASFNAKRANGRGSR